MTSVINIKNYSLLNCMKWLYELFNHIQNYNHVNNHIILIKNMDNYYLWYLLDYILQDNRFNSINKTSSDKIVFSRCF